MKPTEITRNVFAGAITALVMSALVSTYADAALPSSAIDLKFAASCEKGTAVLKITNLGGHWPKSSTFRIYSISDGGKKVVSSRRMGLRADQSLSFRIKASKNPTGQLGLFVDPSWYKRDFDYDATIRCR